MGMFGPISLQESTFETNDLYNPQVLEELFLVDELVNTLSQEELQEFVESAECQALIESGAVSQQSVMYLSKMDDLTRRTYVAAIQMSRSAKDSLYKELEKAMKKREDVLGKIYKKYGIQARKDAKSAQREFIKKVPNRFKRRITVK